MNTRTLLLLSAALLLAAPGAAATDGTALDTHHAVLSGDDLSCGIICCFQDNVLDRTQCTGTFVVHAVAPGGAAGDVVLITWDYAMAVTDVAQEEAQRIVQELIGGVDASARIVCSDDPLGWTVCFAYTAALGPGYWCRGQSGVDYAQCAANGEVDHVQAYEQRMCDHVFQPWVCDLSPAQATDAPESQTASDHIRCTDDPIGYTVCFLGHLTIRCAEGNLVDLVQCGANQAVDSVQEYEQAMCEHVFQPWVCDLSPVAADASAGRIVCPPGVVGETTCFVAYIVLMPSYACTGMSPGTAHTQCLANAWYDHTENYLTYMCDTMLGSGGCGSIIGGSTGPLA